MLQCFDLLSSYNAQHSMPICFLKFKTSYFVSNLELLRKVKFITIWKNRSLHTILIQVTPINKFKSYMPNIRSNNMLISKNGSIKGSIPGSSETQILWILNFPRASYVLLTSHIVCVIMLITVNGQTEFRVLYDVIFFSLLLLCVAVTVATQLQRIL